MSMDLATQWLGLFIKWFHFTAGIAWIGASFYFNWLEGRLERVGKPEGIAGDLWSVHGGGFYHVQKYAVAPDRLPSILHWFKWEAYTTWISGFVLLCVLYYAQAQTYLLDGQSPVSASQGVLISLGMLVVGWIVYDLLCRIVSHQPVFVLLIGGAFLAVCFWIADWAFSGRAAYIQIGAIIGTIMAANVFFVIIPAQKKMVSAMALGEEPDPAPGKSALQRSLHNNYLTLPVLFIMISHHYPQTFGSEWNGWILLALAMGSAGIRHFFNLRNRGVVKVWILPVALAFMITPLLIESVGRGGPQSNPVAADTMVSPPLWRVLQIVDQRCSSCHADNPTFPGFSAPPKGLVLHGPEDIRNAALGIYQQSVSSQVMPLGNVTEMTDLERKTLGAWLRTEELIP